MVKSRLSSSLNPNQRNLSNNDQVEHDGSLLASLHSLVEELFNLKRCSMVKHILITMSAIAVLSNASLHVAVLEDWGAITLGRSWPAHLLSMVMFLVMLATLFIRWNAHALELIQMEHEEKQKYMQECQERGLRDTVWKRLFGATPIWVGVASGRYSWEELERNSGYRTRQ